MSSKTDEAGWRGWVNPGLTYAKGGERTMQVMPVSEHESWLRERMIRAEDYRRLREAAQAVVDADDFEEYDALKALRAALAPRASCSPDANRSVPNKEMELGNLAADWARKAGYYEQALRQIAMPRRPDGSYNRSREACEELARDALAAADHNEETNHG